MNLFNYKSGKKLTKFQNFIVHRLLNPGVWAGIAYVLAMLIMMSIEIAIILIGIHFITKYW